MPTAKPSVTLNRLPAHLLQQHTHTLRVEVSWESQLAYVLLRQNRMCLCVYVCLTCLHTKLLSPVRPYRSDPLLLLFSSTSLLHFAFSSSTSPPVAMFPTHLVPRILVSMAMDDIMETGVEIDDVSSFSLLSLCGFSSS